MGFIYKLLYLFYLKVNRIKTNLKKFILYKIIFRLKIKNLKKIIATYGSFWITCFTLNLNQVNLISLAYLIIIILLCYLKYKNSEFNKIESVNTKILFIVWLTFKLSLGNGFLNAPFFTQICILYLAFTLSSELHFRFFKIYK